MTQNDDNTPQNPSPSFEEMEKMVKKIMRKKMMLKVGDATKIAQLEEQIALLQEKLLRTQADHKYAKTTSARAAEMGSYLQKTSQKLLPIMDDFGER